MKHAVDLSITPPPPRNSILKFQHPKFPNFITESMDKHNKHTHINENYYHYYYFFLGGGGVKNCNMCDCEV